MDVFLCSELRKFLNNIEFFEKQHLNIGKLMFPYSDPSGTETLSRFRAISEWRGFVESEYTRGAKRLGSAFTWIDAILDAPEASRTSAVIEWLAFPILAAGTDAQIDANRRLQEEYVEWAVFRDAQGRIDEIVFTTEFREYFSILAAVSPTGIMTAITDLHPGANPTVAEVYGFSNVNGLAPRQRQSLFLQQLPNNPWNNGEKGIMALTTGVNSVPALFGLAAFCGIDKPGLPVDQVCANVGGACVPGRQSDPRICAACQQQVRDARSFSLIDPIGIFINQLAGIWTLGGAQLPINIPEANQGRWDVTRNGRRGRLKIGGSERLLLDGDEIESGAQVAKKLFVAAEVATVSDTELPEWARIGKENLQRPEERS